MELWQFYQHVWEAERALSAAVPTAWLVRGGVAFAVVKFPREAEPGEWWVEKTWIATPWVFGSDLFGVERLKTPGLLQSPAHNTARGWLAWRRCTCALIAISHH